MKKIFFLLLILSGIAFTQSSWQPEVNNTITVNYLQNMDIFTNKDGNHVLVNDFNLSTGVKSLNYNLLNSSGSVLRSYTIESVTNGMIEFPKISGNDDNLYIVYRSGGLIKTWLSTDVGLNWSQKNNIQVSNNTCMGVEIAYNSYGLHVVWSNRDKGNDYATYYQRYDYYNNLVDYKEVTDFTNGKGGRPTITLSDYKVHVSFDMGQGDLGTNFGLAYTRDKYYSSQNWETEQQVTNFQIMATKAAIKYNQLFLFYYLSVSDMGQYHSDLYVKTRDINGTTWSSPTLIKSWGDVTEIVKVKQTNNGDLNLVYKAGSSLYWRTYIGSVWSDETLISGYPRNTALSFVFNDLFLVSNSGYSGNIHYRQYNSNPSAPQNLVLSNNGGHPRLTWPHNLDADVNQYKIYRNVGNAGWTYLNTTSNLYYNDGTIVISTDPQTSALVEYKITAVDLGSLESQSYSNTVNCRTPGGEYKAKGQNQNSVITNYELQQNFPNPFNPSTTISYQLPKAGFVLLKVYNMLGKEVAVLVNEVKSEGKYSINFNAAGLPSGFYIYSLKVNDFVQNQKMILMK